MAIVLALVSALAYGVSDFLGGIFSKTSSPWRITAISQASAAVCILLVAPWVAGQPSGNDLSWAAVGGVSTGLGAAFLYRGLARARMSVVAPLSAVGSALIPVIIALATGERPGTMALVGIALAFPAIALIAYTPDPDPHHRGGVLDGTLAGIGFGLMFASIGQVSPDAGLWPVAVVNLSGMVAVAVVALVWRQGVLPRSALDWRGTVLGPIGAVAVAAFYLASTQGLLSIVSVIAALYPASTVALAALVLRERVRPVQAVGLALATIVVTLVAAS